MKRNGRTTDVLCAISDSLPSMTTFKYSCNKTVEYTEKELHSMLEAN